MINEVTPIYKEILALLQAALNSPDQRAVNALSKRLVDTRYSDPLLPLLDATVTNRLFPVKFRRRRLSFDDWLFNVNDWVDDYLAPRPKRQTENVLYAVWDFLQKEVKTQLQQARQTGKIPQEGGLIAFISGSSKCVVYEYQFLGALAQLRPLAVIRDPKSLFDFWSEIELVPDAAAKNALKKIVASGHKLVYHRGVLVHVDRRSEYKVFGPTIDTIVLAEVMTQCLLEASHVAVGSAIEVGCGNGLVSAVLVRNCNVLETLVATDIDFASLTCTEKNCGFVLEGLTRKPELVYLGAAFRPSRFRQKFDLCVCNPPYIPVPPNAHHATPERFRINRRATGGTNLLLSMARNIAQIVKPCGTLAMITSGLSLDEFKAAIPMGYEIKQPLGKHGIDAVFDVDAVVGDDEWLAFLINERGLKKRGQLYEHALHALIITRDSAT